MSGDSAILGGAALCDVVLSGASYSEFRFFVFGTGANLGDAVAPSAGADVDGVTRHRATAYVACPGRPVRVETSVAGGNLAAGDTLETDNVGRAVKRSTGVAVARALEASTSTGTIIWAVWSSGR